MSWLALVTACFMYNAWAIPLRGVFPYQTKNNLSYWLACDYFCDLIYLLDILIFKPRVTYLNSGLMEVWFDLSNFKIFQLTQKGMWKEIEYEKVLTLIYSLYYTCYILRFYTATVIGIMWYVEIEQHNTKRVTSIILGYAGYMKPFSRIFRQTHIWQERIIGKSLCLR